MPQLVVPISPLSLAAVGAPLAQAPGAPAEVHAWVVLLPAALGVLSICVLLPQPRRSGTVLGVLAGVLALGLMGFFWTRPGDILAENVLFYSFAGLAVVAGASLVTHSNPVHAALSFALVVLSTCGLFLLQAAPFLMAATLIVYAGAIIVTFLFVIMLAQQSGLTSADTRSHEALLSSLTGLILLSTLVIVLVRGEASGAMAESIKFPAEPAAQLIKQTREAAAAANVAELTKALNDTGPVLLADYRRLAEADRGTVASRDLLAYLRDAEPRWDVARAKNDVATLKETLTALADRGDEIRGRYTEQGVARMPAENVAAMGVSLFSEYFLAVELGGSLLLIATVGAIAIGGRRGDLHR